jgi:hypothetical protein
VVKLVAGINTELTAIQNQMNEIDRVNKIKVEDGETEMIKMLDTSRAIPTVNDPKLKPHQ